MPVKNTETLKRRLLLLSNSSTPAQAYLGHASEIIKDFLGARLSKALFIPFAAVIPSFEDYTTKVRQAFREMGFDVTSIHEAASYKEAILRAEAIIVGGGNTFYLLRRLREQGLLEVIQSCVADGVPYIGWSAGSNIVCPTIKTTNDMPIVDPENLNALNLIPFQINPHFLDFYPSDFPGETRVERITEFIEVNPGVYVVGLRDGSMLRVESSSIQVTGTSNARVFLRGMIAQDFAPGDRLDFLLEDDIVPDRVAAWTL